MINGMLKVAPQPQDADDEEEDIEGNGGGGAYDLAKSKPYK